MPLFPGLDDAPRPKFSGRLGAATRHQVIGDLDRGGKGKREEGKVGGKEAQAGGKA